MNPKEMIFRRGMFQGFRLNKLPYGRKDNYLPTFSNYVGDMKPTRVPRFKVRFKVFTGDNNARWNGNDPGSRTYSDERGTLRFLIP
jgi:hypothetical protein